MISPLALASFIAQLALEKDVGELINILPLERTLAIKFKLVSHPADRKASFHLVSIQSSWDNTSRQCLVFAVLLLKDGLIYGLIALDREILTGTKAKSPR